MRTPAALALITALAACGGRPTAPAPGDGDAAARDARALGAALDTFYQAHLAFRPTLAVELGHHRFDGQVPPRSPEAIAAEVERLARAQATLERISPDGLPRELRLEREIALAELRKERFDLEVRRRPWRDPFYYLRGFSLAPYVIRAYAPLPERARAMLAACRGAGDYYAQAAANLERDLPRPWLAVGQMMARGAIAFVRGDARAALPDLAVTDPALAADLGACLDAMAGQLEGFVAALDERFATATDAYALGADAFLAMLANNEGITTDLATLEATARADLDRNLAALAEAARQLDPARPVADVVAEVSADKPAPADVIAEATAQVDALRAFVVAHDVVSLPRQDVIEVAPSPPFMRGNFAALGGVGPFETAALPSFYYIAPPDPGWPEDEQRAYVPSRWDLLFVTAHEVWPGHFVQGMHQRASGARMRMSFETYTTSEGWAHYVEEMMWDAGLGDGDPRARIGMLKNALLRDVRFVVALGLHTGGMTVEEATALFAEHAFADPANARQQALRGTIDPMYLSYTLGKLIIRKLRDDWQAQRRARGEDASLRAFHDAFLFHGEAPLPVIRRMMLGDDAGPLL